MIDKLKPNETADSIYDIDLSLLYAKGFRNIVLDIDNTITPWNANEITEDLIEWITKARKMGYKICLLSNNKKARVKKIARKLNVIAADGGGKPFSWAFKRAISALQAEICNTIVVGDQIFTDILGGNCINLYTILVNPISKQEFATTKITRWMEKKLVGRR